MNSESGSITELLAIGASQFPEAAPFTATNGEAAYFEYLTSRNSCRFAEFISFDLVNNIQPLSQFIHLLYLNTPLVTLRSLTNGDQSSSAADSETVKLHCGLVAGKLTHYDPTLEEFNKWSVDFNKKISQKALELVENRDRSSTDKECFINWVVALQRLLVSINDIRHRTPAQLTGSPYSEKMLEEFIRSNILTPLVVFLNACGVFEEDIKYDCYGKTKGTENTKSRPDIYLTQTTEFTSRGADSGFILGFIETKLGGIAKFVKEDCGFYYLDVFSDINTFMAFCKYLRQCVSYEKKLEIHEFWLMDGKYSIYFELNLDLENEDSVRAFYETHSSQIREMLGSLNCDKLLKRKDVSSIKEFHILPFKYIIFINGLHYLKPRETCFITFQAFMCFLLTSDKRSPKERSSVTSMKWRNSRKANCIDEKLRAYSRSGNSSERTHTSHQSSHQSEAGQSAAENSSNPSGREPENSQIKQTSAGAESRKRVYKKQGSGDNDANGAISSTDSSVLSQLTFNNDQNVSEETNITSSIYNKIFPQSSLMIKRLSKTSLEDNTLFAEFELLSKNYETETSVYKVASSVLLASIPGIETICAAESNILDYEYVVLKVCDHDVFISDRDSIDDYDEWDLNLLAGRYEAVKDEIMNEIKLLKTITAYNDQAKKLGNRTLNAPRYLGHGEFDLYTGHSCLEQSVPVDFNGTFLISEFIEPDPYGAFDRCKDGILSVTDEVYEKVSEQINILSNDLNVSHNDLRCGRNIIIHNSEVYLIDFGRAAIKGMTIKGGYTFDDTSDIDCVNSILIKKDIVQD